MSLLKTFAEVKASRVIQVASSCSDSDEFRSLVNEATDILLQRGDWPGTVVPARFMVRNGCIVWPRWVGRVRKINQCNVPMKVGNLWWDFVDRDAYHNCCGASYYSDGCSSTLNSSPHGHWNGAGKLVSQGNVPIFNDIPLGHAALCAGLSTKLIRCR